MAGLPVTAPVIHQDQITQAFLTALTPPFISEAGFSSPAIFILVLLESSYDQN